MDLSPEERRRGVEEAFASLRLDGLQPTAAALRDAEDDIEGRRTPDEIIADVVATQPELTLTARASTASGVRCRTEL
jgi:hypothetical protein